MKPPTPLFVMGQRYTVRTYAALEVDGALGITDLDHQTIAISTKQSEDQIADTYLHEALHAIFSLTTLHRDMKLKREEDIIKRMTPALLQVLRDNPRFVEFVTGRSQGPRGKRMRIVKETPSSRDSGPAGTGDGGETEVVT